MFSLKWIKNKLDHKPALRQLDPQQIKKALVHNSDEGEVCNKEKETADHNEFEFMKEKGEEIMIEYGDKINKVQLEGVESITTVAISSKGDRLAFASLRDGENGFPVTFVEVTGKPMAFLEQGATGGRAEESAETSKKVQGKRPSNTASFMQKLVTPRAGSSKQNGGFFSNGREELNADDDNDDNDDSGGFPGSTESKIEENIVSPNNIEVDISADNTQIGAQPESQPKVVKQNDEEIKDPHLFRSHYSSKSVKGTMGSLAFSNAYHGDMINGISFDQHGNEVAVCDNKGWIVIYNFQSHRALACTNVHTALLSVSYMRRGKKRYVACGSDDNKVFTYEVVEAKEGERPERKHLKKIEALESSPLRISQKEHQKCSDDTTRFTDEWGPLGNRPFGEFRELINVIQHEGKITGVALMEDNIGENPKDQKNKNILLAVTSVDKILAIYRIKPEEEVNCCNTDESKVSGDKQQTNEGNADESNFSEDAEQNFGDRTDESKRDEDGEHTVGTNDNIHKFRDNADASRNIENRVFKPWFKLKLPMRVESLSVSADGKKIAFGGERQAIVLEYKTWEINTDGLGTYGIGAMKQMLTPAFMKVKEKEKMEYINDWEETCVLETKGEVSSIGLSGDGKRLMVGSNDKTARLYDVETAAEIHRYRRPARVKSVQLNRDGEYAVVGAFDGKAIRYNVSDGLSPSCVINNQENQEIKAVDISGDGQYVMTCSLGEVNVYHLKSGVRKLHYERKNISDGSNVVVYCGELLHYGDYCLAGGYDKLVQMYDVGNVKDPKVHEFTTNGFVWGLSIRHMKKDSSGAPEKELPTNNEPFLQVAIGSWTGEVDLYEVSQISKSAEKKFSHVQMACFKHDDRIFSTCISGDGNYLAVGTRDCRAVVYDISNKKESQGFLSKPMNTEDCIRTEWKRPERVYSVSISHDSSMVAVSDLEKVVTVYDMHSHKERNSWQCSGIIHAVEFSPNNKILATGGEDNKVVFYDLETDTILLQVPLQGPCFDLDICFKANSFICAEGNRAVVYGDLAHGYGMQDRPSFAMAKMFLNDLDSLKITIESHPTLLNAIGGKDKEKKTLLQLAVEENNLPAAKMLLEGKTKLALLEDAHGNTAMTVAVLGRKKQMLQLILEGIIKGQIVDAPASLKPLYKYVNDFTNKGEAKENKGEAKENLTLFEDIGRQFPDLLLKFLEDYEPQQSESFVLGNLAQAPIKHPIFIGLPRRAPRNFWEKFIDMELKNEQAESKDELQSTEKTKLRCCAQLCCCKKEKSNNKELENEQHTSHRCSPLFCCKGKKPPYKPQHSEQPLEMRKCCFNEKVELAVEASRIPLEGIMQKFERHSKSDVNSANDTGHPMPSEGQGGGKSDGKYRNVSPLEVIVDASRRMSGYSVFKDGTIADIMIQAKWQTIKWHFFLSFLWYCLYLMLFVLHANAIANCSPASLNGYNLKTSELWRNDYDNTWGKIGLLTLPPVVIMASIYMYHEYRQFFRENVDDYGKYKKQHFRKCCHMATGYFKSSWNWLDFPAFPLQLMSCILFLSRSVGARSVAAIAVVLAFIKLLYYCRFWDSFGPLVRMIFRTIHGMGNFLVVIVILLLGFGMTFKILENDVEEYRTFPRAFIQTTLLMYGEFEFLSLHLSDPAEHLLTVIMFEIMLLLVVVVLLNLLIAILSDIYSQVNTNAELEYRLEKASIILEVEKSKAFTRTDARLYPKWVHILKPTTSLEPDAKGEFQIHLEKLLEKAIANEKKQDVLEEFQRTTAAKINKMEVELKRIKKVST